MSNDNNRGVTNTEYLNVTFDEIKKQLVTRAETYYPDTYRDFSKTSFGSLMFDLVAMVGEQLNFYAQFIANEGFIDYARTGIGLTNGARRAGISLTDSPPQGTMLILAPMVVSDDQITPDPTGGYTILKGSLCTGDDGQVVEILEDVVINPLTDKRLATSYGADGTRPLVYYTEKLVKAVAGEIRKFAVEVGDYSHFLKVEVPDPGCTEIISILDSEGNKYYQVDNLSLNTVTKSVRDKNADTMKTVERMIDIPVPRRFTFETEEDRKICSFGYGSENTLKKNEKPAPSKDFLLQKPGRHHYSQKVILPEKYLISDKYGVAPKNTTLTITYRSNNSDNSNIPVGAIDSFLSAEVVFHDEVELGQANMDFIKNTLACTNKEPFNGLVRYRSTKEIALACHAAVGAQGRAVTARDMAGMCYAMPSRFGKVRKAAAHKDTNGLRRNINLYCIAEDDAGNLQKPSSLLKENLKNWISSVKMMSDTIDIFDAKILNLGLHLDLTLRNKEDINTAMPRIREFLYEEMSLTTPEIGQAFSIGEVERILNLMPLVHRVNKVQVKAKSGTNYSDTRYDISPNTARDGSLIYMPEDFIWELKYESDITGIVK